MARDEREVHSDNMKSSRRSRGRKHRFKPSVERNGAIWQVRNKNSRPPGQHCCFAPSCMTRALLCGSLWLSGDRLDDLAKALEAISTKGPTLLARSCFLRPCRSRARGSGSAVRSKGTSRRASLRLLAYAAAQMTLLRGKACKHMHVNRQSKSEKVAGTCEACARFRPDSER